MPDGRGVLGGAWFLPGPWIAPGFRDEGIPDEALADRVRIVDFAEVARRFAEVLRNL